MTKLTMLRVFLTEAEIEYVRNCTNSESLSDQTAAETFIRNLYGSNEKLRLALEEADRPTPPPPVVPPPKPGRSV